MVPNKVWGGWQPRPAEYCLCFCLYSSTHRLTCFWHFQFNVLIQATVICFNIFPLHFLIKSCDFSHICCTLEVRSLWKMPLLCRYCSPRAISRDRQILTPHDRYRSLSNNCSRLPPFIYWREGRQKTVKMLTLEMIIVVLNKQYSGAAPPFHCLGTTVTSVNWMIEKWS